MLLFLYIGTYNVFEYSPDFLMQECYSEGPLGGASKHYQELRFGGA